MSSRSKTAALAGGRTSTSHGVPRPAAALTVPWKHAGANRNDHKLLKGTLDSIPIARPEPSETSPQGICLDRAYDNADSRELGRRVRPHPHIHTRGEEPTRPAGAPRRGVVEACHSWLNRNRAILIR